MKFNDEIPIPNNFEVKEVFAFFGLAAYHAQVMEKGLLIFAVGLNIARIPKVTRALVDELFTTHERKTFGQLFRIAREANILDEPMVNRLKNALEQRNYLTHQLFYDYAGDFTVDSGRKVMIDELRRMTDIFINMDKDIEAISKPLWEKYGITESIIDKGLEDIIKSTREKYEAI